jgi:putative ABC transport system substrate-binding protein
MTRRGLLLGFGGAFSVLRAAHAEQKAAPVIGFVGAGNESIAVRSLAAFRDGLSEAGYADGRNVVIEFQSAEGRYEQLPMLLADLVHRQVALIVASGNVVALAAKAATQTVPVVFTIGADPVKNGLVASLKRPGGNITGVTVLLNTLLPKRLELLHELVPTATVIGSLVNPNNPNTAADSDRIRVTANAIGCEYVMAGASTVGELAPAFTALVQQRVGALLIHPDAFLNTRSEQLISLAARHALPANFAYRQFVEAGGLMSYGASETDHYRIIGGYAGRILNGEKPADLPVQQSTKVELVLNLKTAKALGLVVPQSILARADEVIE